MRQYSSYLIKCLLFISPYFLLSLTVSAQQTTMKDYVLFGGNGSCPGGTGQSVPALPGCAVQLSSSTNIQGGSIGSYRLIKTTGNSTINANIYSGGTIELANSNIVTGRISSANSPVVPGTILSIGSSTSVSGNIDVNGNIVIGGGTVSGRVTHPNGTTYSGPVPTGGEIIGAPSLIQLPPMRSITNFPAAPNSPDFTSNAVITPGAYHDIKLSGNKTITFKGAGVYVFNSINNGNGNQNFIFDFNNNGGVFKIYVHGDVNLGKLSASVINGGNLSDIFTEIHGNGSTINSSYSFILDNGSSNSSPTKWLGTVWAPYGGINIGSGSGSSNITGALWSGTQVNIQSGVNMIYAPFPECTPPNVYAGLDKPLKFVGLTTLTGTSTTTGVSFNWQATNGGVITSPANAASITVSSAGTYVLTASLSGECPATDTVIVTGKTNSIIGSELESVYENFDPNAPPSPFFSILHDSIMIDVITKENQYAATLALLTTPAYGLSNIISNGTSNYIITGLFPISKLKSLNLLTTYIVYVRPYYGALGNSGITSTAGDISLRSDMVRQGYKLSGDGIKVGVISNSFNTITAATTNPITNTASQDVGNGDLPGPGNPNGNLKPVVVLKDYPFKSSDEGRAMLQIVHDIAPKAELLFRTGFISAGDFAKGITDLRDSGCNVIVDDITYITEPFLKDGVAANAVDAVTATGTTYISAAGNFANKSYESAYNPVAIPAGIAVTAHNFGGGDKFQSVTLNPGDYTIVLQWLDDIYSLGQTSTGGTKHDLDIYLTPNTDGSALFGFNRNNTNGDPIEILPFTLNTTVTTNVFITNNTVGSNPARFKYIIFRGGDIVFNEYSTGNSTIVGQANAVGAIAVGAVRYDKAPPFAGPPVIESFSSIGGTVVGTSARNKPELVAPDGVNTTVKMGQDYPTSAPDGYSNFFGTSAAAPHVAAVAALIMEGKQKYSNQQITLPAEIRSILQSSATDMYTPGFDFSSGYGFVNADSAMRTFAKPNPTLIQLVVPATVTTPGTNTFVLTVTGLNLSPNSVIRFRDSTLVTTVINSTTATAVVPAFIGNPSISVFTPPISSSGLDGGTSDTLKFFNIAKKTIKVIANNVTKKYAQLMPALISTIIINGESVQSTQLTTDSLTKLGLGSLVLNTLANTSSDVGTYVITPIRNFESSNSSDIGYKELYDYSFANGTATIEKLPVTVTANDQTVVYGEKIPDITFNYQFDGTNIPDPTAFLNSLQTSHHNQLATDASGNDILGLVNGQAVTIVNGQAVPIVNGQAVTIVNGQAVTIVNGQAIPIVNGQAITIVNGQAVTIVNNLSENEVQQLSFLASTPTLQNARQLTNRKLVNGVYVTSSTQVVDVTQESILKYNVNSAQTYMLSSVSQTSAKGLIDINSFTNGQAVTIVNGQAVTIVNGQAVTIVNGQAVTIVNGQAVTIVNGQAIPIVNNQDKTAVILNESEIGQGQSPLKSLNLITGIDVGYQFVIPGSLLNDNLLITHIAGEITVLPATVTITPTAGQTKVYGENDPVLTYSNNAGLTANDFTGNIARVAGSNVGAYAFTIGTLSAGNNYTLSLAGTNSFAITKKQVSITPIAGQTKVYGSVDPVFTYTNNAGLTASDFTGILSRATGNNVGTYAYTIGTLSAGSNYMLNLVTGNTFSISKALLNVKANDNYIYKGSQLPSFTSVFTTLKNGDNPTVSYTLSPAYTGEAGVYTIIPLLNSFANAVNYTISYTNGNFYVNPKGNGAKKLRPYLDCIEELVNPAPGTLAFVAHFYCINDNSTPLYVPIGPDNLISSAGSFDNSQQAKVFYPGNTYFNVPFDGNTLKWELTTYETNKKSATSSNASSGSNRCTYVTSGKTTNPNPVKTNPEINKPNVNAMLSVFPNPAGDRTTINIANEQVNEKSLQLFNAQGKLVPFKVIGSITNNSFVIDLSRLSVGMYFLRVKLETGTKTICILKE